MGAGADAAGAAADFALEITGFLGNVGAELEDVAGFEAAAGAGKLVVGFAVVAGAEVSGCAGGACTEAC